MLIVHACVYHAAEELTISHQPVEHRASAEAFGTERLGHQQPTSALACPYFFNLIACTLMNPPVSTGSKLPISSILLSLASYSLAV